MLQEKTKKAAMRLLAYEKESGPVDGNIRLYETTAPKSLRQFRVSIINIFGSRQIWFDQIKIKNVSSSASAWYR